MNVKKAKYIRIFDTTLRDGEQTPGVSLTVDDKIEIAHQLNKLGVDVIEAGSPMSSEGEKKVVKAIAKEGLTSEVCALARATKGDIDKAIDCDVDLIHLFIPTSPVQMKYAVNLSTNQVLAATVEMIEYIKKHGLKCEFSPMDATRSEMSFLKQVCKAAENTGADMINIPDTVGIMIPRTMSKFITEIKSSIKAPISIHCHDDFGMAVANSLAAVEAGAEQVHCTINGLGERAGNASLEEIVMALHMIYKMKTSINSRLLYSTSRIVATLTGLFVQANKAGTRGIKAELDEVGIQVNEKQLKEIVKRIKNLGDKGKMVTDADLIAITSAVIGEVIAEEKIVDLCDLAVMTGIKVIPTASVRLVLDGTEYSAAETGVGPVDAVLKAIQKLTRNLAKISLNEYRLEAITGGSNAVAEVVIKVEDEKGNIVSARGAREDIVMASVEAMINGINKCLIKNRKQVK
jgi:isopropylmalate/homocitrate/citramalate synthase